MNLPANTPPSDNDGFERHYRAGSQEVPGAAVDAAVLALARAAAAIESGARASAARTGGDAEARGWSRRWQAPLALAACLVLAVGVVTRMQTGLPELAEMPDGVANKMSGPPQLPASRPPAESGPPVAAAPASAFPSRAEPALARAAQTEAAQKTGNSKPATTPVAEVMSAPSTPSMAATSPAPATAKTADAPGMADAASGASRAMQRDQPMPQGAAPAMTPDAATGSELRASARMATRKPGVADADITEMQESALNPQAWLARIVALRGSGRIAEADASLKRFRDRYPAIQVPPAASGQSE